jgi:hypothetical protein
MKQKMPLKTQSAASKCNTTACSACESCKTVEFEKVGQKPAAETLQLYAKEAENYFFYYAPDFKKYN